MSVLKTEKPSGLKQKSHENIRHLQSFNHQSKLPMSPNNYSHYTANSLQVKVIQSQHCIEVEGTQIELIYLFGANTLHVYLEDKLVLSTQIRVNKTMVNYSNLIEVAVNYWKQEENRKRKIEKEELKELNQQQEATPTKDLKAYILESITQIIE